MANLKVQRKTLEGESTAFTFETVGLKFLVKNLSSQPCLVNFEPVTAQNEDSSILIPKEVAQLVLTNEHAPTGTKELYVKGTGDVEVQIVLW